MIPISSAFGSNVNMTYLGVIPPGSNVSFFALPPASETVLLYSGTSGFPAEVSSVISATIVTTNGNETYPLNSATPAVSVVLPNPSNTPAVINYYTYGLLIGIFLLPISLIVMDWRIKARRLKKESVEGV
jgi:hypothetical protein